MNASPDHVSFLPPTNENIEFMLLQKNLADLTKNVFETAALPRLHDNEWGAAITRMQSFTRLSDELLLLRAECAEITTDNECDADTLLAQINGTLEYISESVISLYVDLSHNYSKDTYKIAHESAQGELFDSITTLTITTLMPTGEGSVQKAIPHFISYFAEQHPQGLFVQPRLFHHANTETQGSIVRTALEELFPTVTKTQNQSTDTVSAEKFLTELMIIDNEQLLDSITEIFNTHIQTTSTGSVKKIDIFDAWFTKATSETESEEQEYLTTCLRGIKAVWDTCGREGVWHLYTEYGIRHFHNFPKEVLIAQANHTATDPAKLFAIFTLSYSDETGALATMEDTIRKTWLTLQQTHHIVCIEVKHRYELLRKLARVRRNYRTTENEGRADFIVIAGHGDQTSIDLGGTESHTAELATSALQHTHVSGHRRETGEKATYSPALADNILKPSGKVVLLSCLVGDDEGLASNASAFFNRDVIAPQFETDGEKITFTQDNDGAINDISVIYQNDGTTSLGKKYAPQT